MKVLVACEFSGIVRDAFLERGHDAYSCDLLETESPKYKYTYWPQCRHMRIDAIRAASIDSWDLVIAHPPCTYLCNSGVRWLHEQPDRWEKMVEAAKFMKALMEYGDKSAVENPIPHKYAVREIGRKYDQIIHPWQFGHGESKSTCLWLRGLPKLKPTSVVDGREQRVWKLPPSKDRWKERSRTFTGIAAAMADQWGSLA